MSHDLESRFGRAMKRGEKEDSKFTSRTTKRMSLGKEDKINRRVKTDVNDVINEVTAKKVSGVKQKALNKAKL